MSWSTSYASLVTTLTGGSGDQPGLDIRGRMPGQLLRVVGATSLAALATGLNSFTAGTGTSTTSVAKQTGAADYTSNDLAGKWLKRIGGGGYVAGGDNLRPILSNTTTTIAINAMSGLDNTSVCQVVDLASKVDRISAGDPIGLRLSGNLGPIELVGLDFSATHTLDGLLELVDCIDVTLTSCAFSQNLANPSASAARIQKLTLNHCRLTSSADMAISQCQNVIGTGNVNAGGGVIDIQDCTFVDLRKLSADSAPSRVLSIKRAFSVKLEADCNDGGASPLYLESCTSMTAVGGLLTGSGNTGYGLELAGGGQYTITGSTITGSARLSGTPGDHTCGDVLFDTRGASYSLELGNTYGAMANATMRLVAQTSVTKVIELDNRLWDGSGDHSSRELYYGITNPSQGTATAAGSNVSDATQLGAEEHVAITSCSSGQGVKLHNLSALRGVRQWLDNETANACVIYPSNGGTIDGGSSYSLAVGAMKCFICVDFATDKWKVL